MNKTQILITSALAFSVLASCSTRDKVHTTDNSNKPKQGGERGEAPSIEEIFEMDANNDGKLSESEVSGPLLKDFVKIDTNKDGFLSKEEVRNAPKPQGGRPSHGGGRSR